MTDPKPFVYLLSTDQSQRANGGSIDLQLTMLSY
jgi:hypothetical protein